MPSKEVMSKFKHGQLHSGSKSGKKVTNRKQALAIMLSEKRNEANNGGTYKSGVDTGPSANFKKKFKGFK